MLGLEIKMIRQCKESDINTILEIINDAAQAYKGVIPEDLWADPYMPIEELMHEIGNGVVFYGLEHHGQLFGVMGIQHKDDVTLIRHSYVRTRSQKIGIGTKLLQHLESLTEKPVLIGTWAVSLRAISFYKKSGYALLSDEEKNRLLRKYWSIPERQVETSVVLANRTWFKAQHSLQPTANRRG
jgi:N-acetylglutamate synthase-like GNAT family acetyltransferase